MSNSNISRGGEEDHLAAAALGWIGLVRRDRKGRRDHAAAAF